jgi:hypothetical protein
MPRRYGPGHFTEDPYSQVVSPHGSPVDDLVAVLQKEIRRSHIDATPDGDWMMACHAVRLLASAPKDRASSIPLDKHHRASD